VLAASVRICFDSFTSSCSECGDDEVSKGRNSFKRWPDYLQLVVTDTCSPKGELKESHAKIESICEEFFLGNYCCLFQFVNLNVAHESISDTYINEINSRKHNGYNQNAIKGGARKYHPWSIKLRDYLLLSIIDNNRGLLADYA